MKDLQEWEVFRSAYHTLSLTRTAAELGIATNVASARLLALERRLGRALFNRSTRPFQPTAAAHAVIRDVEAMLNGLGMGLTMPLYACIDDLESGRLVPVLNGWHRPSQPNWLACRRDDWNIAHLRKFVQWLAAEMALHETACERRFATLFGEDRLQEYASGSWDGTSAA